MTQQDRWHADTVALRQYATGTATDAVGWSVETHLTGCIVCRARLAHLFTDADRSELSRLRCELSVADGLAQSPASPRAALRGVLGPWWAWIGLVVTAFTAVTLLGVVPTPQSGLLTSWAHVLAPLVPLGMVAVVYALADRDPAAAVTPRGGLELALIRTAAVLVVTGPTVTAGMVTIGGGGGAAWLLPGLALCAGALALGPSVGIERACVGLTALWLAVVAVASPPSGLASAAAVIQPSGVTNALWAGALFAAIVVVAAQRERFDLPGRLS